MKKQICLRVYGMGLWVSILFACQSANKDRADSARIEDFSLDQNAIIRADRNDRYYSDLEKSNAMIPFKSSFPLSFSIAGTPSRFKSVPLQAQTPLSSRLMLRMGACHFFLKTGPIQVNRYLYTGNWIKFGEEISPRSTVKLASMMDLNLKMSSQLEVEIPKQKQSDCRRLLYGHRTFIGWYHLNQSMVGLIQSPGTRPTDFQRAAINLDGVKVYLYWHKGWDKPVLRNDMEFPAVVESPIYRTQMNQDGFYYVRFHPVLRLKNLDQMIIDIPHPLTKPSQAAHSHSISNHRPKNRVMSFQSSQVRP